MLIEQSIRIINLIFEFSLFIVVIYNVVFFIWILSSWLPVNRSIIILRFVDNLINPVYYGLLRVLPPIRFGIMDFSPFYMYIFLMVVETIMKLTHTLVLRLAISMLG